MIAMSVKLSETYQQLGEIFKSLESAHFEEGKDFGENLTGCFKWFISPPAVLFLEKRAVLPWTKVKHNERFKWNLEPWEGYKAQGVSIDLVL